MTKVKKTFGLTSSEAQVLLKQYGKNEIVASAGLNQLQQIVKIFSDPMGLMMLGLSVLYFLTGAKTDAVIILIAYIPVTAVDVFLELRSEKALQDLKSNFQTKAKVYRDGVLTDLPIQFIVPGDVLAFEEGQSLPADGKILESNNLSVNESALTGESLPVEKSMGSDFFAGTMILNGRGMGLIERTGKFTKFGKISDLLEETDSEKSPLQKRVHALVKKIVILAAVFVVLLFCIEYFRGNSFINSLIAALTLGMAAVPEEFPVVFTLYLSLGAWRLSKYGVLVKTLPSVESLGNVDIICTDKTGTLTEGRFSLVEVVPFCSLSPEQINLIALLSCEPVPVDAMEAAIFEKLQINNPYKDIWKLIHDYPFEAQGKHMTHIWSDDHGKSILAMKGAVEGVLEHSNVSESEKIKILEKVNELASGGKRILGLATKNGSFTGQREIDEKDVQFVGLLVFTDPVRKSAQKAIEACQNAGVEVKMLTGDHHLTAHAIADELNITHTDQSIYNGSQLDEMNSQDRAEAYLRGSIFARVSPTQKYEMIKTLKEQGKIVAMTGDGINDSPALKLADIGVSMGENATDVARSTANMILLKNDFNGIIQAILEGRNIFINLRRSFSYLIAFHIPVVLLAFLPPLLGWQQLLLPVHIILLELIVHPISAFAFENLKSKVSRAEGSLVPTNTLMTAVFSGTALSALSLLLVAFSDPAADFNHTRSLVISTVLFGNIGFTTVEAWPHLLSRRIALILFVLVLLPVIFCNVTFLSHYFHMSKITSLEFLGAFAIGMLASVPTFIYRLRSRRDV